MIVNLENKFPPSLDWSDFDVWTHLWADVAKTSRKSANRRRSWPGVDDAEAVACAGCRVERSLKDRLGLVNSQRRQQKKTTSTAQTSETPMRTAYHTAYVQFAAGALGGSTATYTTHWLDTLKVKMQTFPQNYPSTTRCLTHTLHHEGVRGLYQGAIPAVVGHTTKAAIVFMSYGLCEEMIRKVVGKSDTSQLTVCNHASAGAATGVLASFVLCPLELIKCRMQAMHQLTSSSTNVKQVGAVSMARNILQNEGVRGLYRGLNGMWVKEVPGSFIYFGSYEAAKALMREIKDTQRLSTLEVFLCGIGAGLCFCVTHPIESVKTRVQVMSAVDEPKGFLRSTFQILRTEGVRPLCSGIKPSMLRACSYSGIQFVMYELTKDYLLDNDRGD